MFFFYNQSAIILPQHPKRVLPHQAQSRLAPKPPYLFGKNLYAPPPASTLPELSIKTSKI